jgi:hypothetical protein
MGVLDALAELSAISRVIFGVGVTWKPAVSTGPQYPEWDQHLRFARNVTKVAEEIAKRSRENDDAEAPIRAYATLAEVTKAP